MGNIVLGLAVVAPCALAAWLLADFRHFLRERGGEIHHIRGVRLPVLCIIQYLYFIIYNTVLCIMEPCSKLLTSNLRIRMIQIEPSNSGQFTLAV